jgi:hypothetical protein
MMPAQTKVDDSKRIFNIGGTPYDCSPDQRQAARTRARSVVRQNNLPAFWVSGQPDGYDEFNVGGRTDRRSRKEVFGHSRALQLPTVGNRIDEGIDRN